MGQLFELVESQRTVVEGRRQTESIFHKVGLASPVATVHTTNLGYRDVALVDNHQEIVWEEVEQAIGTLASLTTVEIARVVLNA